VHTNQRLCNLFKHLIEIIIPTTVYTYLTSYWKWTNKNGWLQSVPQVDIRLIYYWSIYRLMTETGPMYIYSTHSYYNQFISIFREYELSSYANFCINVVTNNKCIYHLPKVVPKRVPQIVYSVIDATFVTNCQVMPISVLML